MARQRFPMGMGGMGNANNMIKQAQKMQQEMLKAQEEIESTDFEATSGGGAVSVKMTGKKELTEIADEGKTFPVSCQFCDTVYQFTPADIRKLIQKS